MTEHTLIVGAGQAGATVAAHLRELGYPGQISIVGSEPHAPYQRPPLSKKFLSGEWPQQRLLLRPESFWSDHDIGLLRGKTVEAIDLANRRISAGGEMISWDKLVLTTGTRPRTLTHTETDERLHSIYSIEDVARLKSQFRPGTELAIIGGGYVGLEIAAVAKQTGLGVTLVEQAERILNRVACTETATCFRQLHVRHGVRILEGTKVAGIKANPGNKRILELSTGERLVADVIVAGIGAIPNVELAEAAGLEIENGIKTNARGRTSAANVWAAGDCASFPLNGTTCRLENIQNAVDMAETVAKDIIGNGQDYRPIPWFWSDQYDVKLQIAGLNHGFDRIVSTTSAKGVSNWYFKDRRMIAVDAMNDPRAYMAARRLLERNIEVEPSAFDRPDFQPLSLLA